MKRLLQTYLGSWPTVFVLALVLLAGGRLIDLSVQHHALIARQTAARVAADYAAKIELPLQKLQSLAARQAAIAAQVLPNSGAVAPQGVPLATDTYWMTADDKVQGARDPSIASAISSEWQSAESLSLVVGPSVLGPVRIGSGWYIAIRVPIVPPASKGETPTLSGWAVAYQDMDELIADSHLPRLIDAGYDFELSQAELRSGRSRSFVSSRTEPLGDAVAAMLHLPTAAAIPGSYLQVLIRPRAGWYPATLLAAEIGLLGFLAWGLAFGTHDLLHALQRSHAALAVARSRLKVSNQRLAAEMKQRLAVQQTFDHARFHDAFTGLPNRRYFMDQLDRALRDLRAKRRQRLAVIIVNVTRFKLINDTLGHTAGDELMVQAARRFEKSISSLEGVLARWSGDQFALLLLDVLSGEAASNIAILLQEELRPPIELRRHRIIVAATVGVTYIESGQQRAEEVVREADIALSMAKRQEMGNVVMYSSSMAGQAANLVSLEADLHVALERHELRLLYQPIVDLSTSRMVGAEALLRWRHPVESVLAPDRFLSIAEEAGLMVPITQWVILRVVKLAVEWRKRLSPNQPFFISINLSPVAVRDPLLSEFVGSVLRETGLPPAMLKFEVTEAALINNVGAARETLERLHALGVQLMLDDFGTGYSSLSYLQLFPFDFVKIDRPFVNRTGTDSANTGMIAAMLQMAGSLHLTAVAEIVDTEAAATALREMGCQFGQGFYFSVPLPAEAALQRLKSREPFLPAPQLSQSGDKADPHEELSATRVLPVLSEHDPSTSQTARIRISDVDPSPTRLLSAVSEPDPLGSATAIVRPISEEASQTFVLPMLDLDLEQDDEAEKEEQ